ncbi:hypothetical protein ACFVU3_19960 [Streptomyces sp. NPDC058052]|uniref:hypothetical protein n=1 Tax=Streptomyces sp. NPDC058052 TaxID=3346316 RepID=UPI0036E0C682
MTSAPRRRPAEAASLLLSFALVGLTACSRGGRPRRGRLRRVAASEEVRRMRERAGRDLRARADEIGALSSWGPPPRTTMVDTCSRGGGRNLFDGNAPEQPAMSCTMRLHLYFVVDRPVPHVLRDLRSMETPTVWSGGSIRGALESWEAGTHERRHASPPWVGSRTGGELLAWDAPGDDAGAKVPEPYPAPRAILRTSVSEPAGLTLSALRERPGTLFAWTLTARYHEVWSTRRRGGCPR